MARIKTCFFEPFDRNFFAFRFPFDNVLKEAIKVFPGVNWEKDERVWLIPRELAPQIAVLAKGFGRDPVYEHEDWTPSDEGPDRPYQNAAVDLINHNGAGLLTFEMGLGKSRPAVRIGLQNTPTLIMCPAGVRYTWPTEIRLVSPSASIQIIESGHDKLDRTADFVICSFGMLRALWTVTSHFKAVVIDEIHNCQNADSSRSQAVRSIITSQPESVIRVGLTGTPITDRLGTIINPLDILFPKRFGSYWKFTERYGIIEHSFVDAAGNKKGRKVTGVNPAHADELIARLQAVSIRATAVEWAHLLPPLNFLPVWERLDEVDIGYVSDDETHMSLVSEAKAQWASSFAWDMLEGAPRVAVLAYRKEVARKIADTLIETARDQNLMTQIFHIDGEMPIRKRIETIEQAAGMTDSILVCTLHSIKEGLNCLTPFTDVVLSELYYRPVDVFQALKRFHRNGSPRPVTIKALGFLGTKDEEVMHSLIGKAADINTLIKSGAIEGVLEQGAMAGLDLDNALEGAMVEAE